jgi:hypothetical protein
MCEAITNMFKKSFKINIHAWASELINILKGDHTNENQIRIRLKLTYAALNTIVSKGHLKTWEKGHTQRGRINNYTQSPRTFIINREKWARIIELLNMLGCLNSITFTPKVLAHNPQSNRILLSSKDKVQQINTMNATKVFFNPTWAKFLFEELIPLIHTDKEKFITILNLNTKEEFTSTVQHIMISKILYQYINKFIRALGTEHYYNTHFTDNRGRVYTTLTHFRHIRAKWLRPLFVTENSYYILPHMTYRELYQNSKLSANRAYNYIIIVLEEQ